ncbi:MAG: DUF6285 domain-containing protein [Burkholderiales bacterium]|jgi:hypothetical protein
METTPSAAELIAAATEALRDELLPALSGRAAFQARVVANVLDIARRELERGPAADAAELARLRALLGAPDTDPLPGLRAALCDAIREGRVTLDTPGLADHLWADTMARLAIEQPAYPSFVREARPDPTPPAAPTAA